MNAHLLTGDIPSPCCDRKMTLDEIRALIDAQIARGLENTPGEIITIHGLESEYPELMAKLYAEESAI